MSKFVVVNCGGLNAETLNILLCPLWYLGEPHHETMLSLVPTVAPVSAKTHSVKW